MDYFSMYVYLIFAVKIIFIILALYERTLKSGKKDMAKEEKVAFWKERVEFIFVLLMSLLLIYVFFPRANRINLVTGEVKLLLFLFGIVLIITANWSLFFKESRSYQEIQYVLGKNR
jgi:hypothetical protein